MILIVPPAAVRLQQIKSRPTGMLVLECPAGVAQAVSLAAGADGGRRLMMIEDRRVGTGECRVASGRDWVGRCWATTADHGSTL